MPPPQYFPLNVKMNKEGYDDFGDVLKRSTQALSPEAFEAAVNETEAIAQGGSDFLCFKPERSSV